MADNYAYLLVRTDLPSLGYGKAYAHAMHAGNQMTYRELVEPLIIGVKTPHFEDLISWHKLGEGFGTTIALGKDNQMSIETIDAVIDAAKNLGFVADHVTDPTYPYLVDLELFKLLDSSVHTAPAVSGPRGFKVCFRKEVSCAYVWGDKDQLKVLLGQFGLAPNE